MGNIRSSLRATSSTSVASTTVSRTIDKKIKADQKRMKKEVKLLLLGKKKKKFFFPSLQIN